MFNVTNLQPAAGPCISKREYARRLNAYYEAMPEDSVAIIVARPEQPRSNDTHYAYRQASDLLYMIGFPEPDAALVICKLSKLRGAKSKRFIMFVLPKDPSRELWTGIREGVEGAKKKYLADEAHTNDKFAEVVGNLLSKASIVFYRFGINGHFDEEFRKLWQVREIEDQTPLGDPLSKLHEMRLFKSKGELKVMRHAAQISARAHCVAMAATKPGLKERQIQGVLEGMFQMQGAPGVAYTTIVAGGNNGNVLHYVSNADTLKDGDLVLVDAACEYAGYASDITRTWPVNGKFTEAQREIYELVLKSQLAAIKAIRAGKPMYITQTASERVLRKGLKKLGILPTDATKRNDVKAVRAKAKAAKAKNGAAVTETKQEPAAPRLRDFFMHGTSHWMGHDVHDVGRHTKPGKQAYTHLWKQRALEPGMVLTVEPALYFNKNDTRIPAKYRGIAVRIEDDVVVTQDGCEVLTKDVPKTVEEIEALMASR